MYPTPLTKFLRVFASTTAKNGHLPPRSVSGGHKVAVVADPGGERAGLKAERRRTTLTGAGSTASGVPSAVRVLVRS